LWILMHLLKTQQQPMKINISGPDAAILCSRWVTVTPRRPQYSQFDSKGAFKRQFGTIFGPSWAHLGPMWANMGPSWSQIGHMLEPLWARLCYWIPVGPIWDYMGPHWCPSERMSGHRVIDGVGGIGRKAFIIVKCFKMQSRFRIPKSRETAIYIYIYR
jgi:hypothetical protein